MSALRAGSGLFALAALVQAFLWHVSLGAKTIPFLAVADAFLSYDDRVLDHVVIHDLRLPRALTAVAVGAGR